MDSVKPNYFRPIVVMLMGVMGVTLAAGYAFSQELTTGFDSDNEDKLTDLSDQPYLRIGLEVGF